MTKALEDLEAGDVNRADSDVKVVELVEDVSGSSSRSKVDQTKKTVTI
jgi:hypothetical protein